MFHARGACADITAGKQGHKTTVAQKGMNAAGPGRYAVEIKKVHWRIEGGCGERYRKPCWCQFQFQLTRQRSTAPSGQVEGPCAQS